MPDVTTQNHWENPMDPHDVNYDGDSDGYMIEIHLTFPQPKVFGRSKFYR